MVLISPCFPRQEYSAPQLFTWQMHTFSSTLMSLFFFFLSVHPSKISHLYSYCPLCISKLEIALTRLLFTFMSCLCHWTESFLEAGIISYSLSLALSTFSVPRIWVCVCVHSACSSLSHAWLFATLWTVAHQAPLSMGFPRQKYWSRLLFFFPRDLANPGIKPVSPALQNSLLLSQQGSPNKRQSDS